MGDKELRTTCVFARVCHAQTPGEVHPRIRTVAFALDRVSGTSTAIITRVIILAVRVSSLSHETGHDAVKCNAVVKSGVDERNKIGDRVGGWPDTVAFTYCSKTDAAFSSKSTKKTAQLLFVCLYPTQRIRLRKGFTLVSLYAASSEVAKMAA